MNLDQPAQLFCRFEVEKTAWPRDVNRDQTVDSRLLRLSVKKSISDKIYKKVDTDTSAPLDFWPKFLAQ